MHAPKQTEFFPGTHVLEAAARVIESGGHSGTMRSIKPQLVAGDALLYDGQYYNCFLYSTTYCITSAQCIFVRVCSIDAVLHTCK
jgi:hypothetical protein